MFRKRLEIVGIVVVSFDCRESERTQKYMQLVECEGGSPPIRRENRTRKSLGKRDKSGDAIGDGVSAIFVVSGEIFIAPVSIERDFYVLRRFLREDEARQRRGIGIRFFVLLDDAVDERRHIAACYEKLAMTRPVAPCDPTRKKSLVKLRLVKTNRKCLQFAHIFRSKRDNTGTIHSSAQKRSHLDVGDETRLDGGSDSIRQLALRMSEIQRGFLCIRERPVALYSELTSTNIIRETVSRRKFFDTEKSRTRRRDILQRQKIVDRLGIGGWVETGMIEQCFELARKEKQPITIKKFERLFSQSIPCCEYDIFPSIVDRKGKHAIQTIKARASVGMIRFQEYLRVAA